METTLQAYQHTNKFGRNPNPNSIESRLIEVIQRRLKTASPFRNPANTVGAKIFTNSKCAYVNAMDSVAEADLNSASRNRSIYSPRLIKSMREADLNRSVELALRNKVPRHDLTKDVGCNFPHGSVTKLDKI